MLGWLRRAGERVQGLRVGSVRPGDPAVVTVAGHTLTFRRVDSPMDSNPSAVDASAVPRIGPSQRLVIGLHGLGANERQVSTLMELAVDGAYLALRGSVPRGDGYGWFDPPIPQTVGQLLDGLDPLVAFVRHARLQAGASAAQTTVVGYSQAAALAAALGQRHPRLVGSVVLASAALPAVLGDLEEGAPPRAFIGVGLRDPLVDREVLDPLVRRWRSRGAVVTVREYDIPHVVSPAECRDIERWIADRPLTVEGSVA